MKENKVVINILLIIIMILVVAGCGIAYLCFTNDVEIIEQQEEIAIFSEESYPKVESSAITLPLAEAYKAEFTKTDINDVEIMVSKTNNAYINLINKNTDLILVPYPSEEEQKLAQDKGIELEIVPIVKDAFVFYVNKNNLVDNLTLNQVQNIYSGKTKNWKEVGGNDSKIVAFQRPESSDSQIAMVKNIMKGIKMIEPKTETVSQNMTDIIDVISDYDNGETSIGYSYYYYATKMYMSEDMKVLSINGIQPTYDNIKTGLYGLQTAYYAVIRKDEPEDSNVRKLLEAMISEKGQNIAKEAGYVQNY